MPMDPGDKPRDDSSVCNGGIFTGTAAPRGRRGLEPQRLGLLGMRQRPHLLQRLGIDRRIQLQQGDSVLSLRRAAQVRSEEHTSELQSLMRISYAVFCLKKKKKTRNT